MGEQEEGVKPDPIAECSQCARPFMRRTTLHRVCSPLRAIRDDYRARALTLKGEGN